MKAKYFSADSRVAAETKAETFFGVGASEIVFENAGPDEESVPVLILALTGKREELQNADASYGLYYEDDGVYLEIYRERGAGATLAVQALSKHISRKNINGLDPQAVQAIVAQKSGRKKIAAAQREHIYGEDLTIEITKDEMKVFARLLEPDFGGAALEIDAARKKIEEAGVTNGIDANALKTFLEAKDYGEPFLVAQAVAPTDGEAGKLIYHFSTDERTGRPREIGGGRVDYRSLDLFLPVSDNELLVERIPATEGIPGTTVTGKELKPKPGKEVNLPRGKNVEINEDRTEMRAKTSGMVEFLKGSVTVSNIYKVNGDCDLSTGNIDFDGSVHISGSVRSGHTVKATGAVVIGGTVEAATVISGGNVEIKGGVQGSDKGRIEAAGSITMLFIERGAAIADGSIKIDVSIHSTLEAGGTITAKGKRGAIIGGRAGAAGDIITSFIGAVSNTHTEIEVGVTPKKRARIQTLEKDMERVRGEIVKLDQLDAYLEKTKDKMDPETWDRLYRSGVENRRLSEQNMEDYTIEANDLKYELEHATDSKVHVLDTAFGGSRIIIGNGIYKVTGDIQFATFRYKDAEVTYGPCEKSKSS